jgi:FAD/FMN-containing dehydrogenase
MIFGGALFMPPTREVLRSLGPIAASAPEALSTISFLMAAPPAPFIPAELHGKPTLAIMFVYDGDAEAGEAAIEPFRQVATPMAELVMPMPYPGIYEMLKDAEEPSPAAHRSLFLESLDDATVDTILEFTAKQSSPATMTQIRILGGAMSRVPAGATAFAHRDAGVMVIIITQYQDPAEAPIHQAFTQAYFEALRPGSTGVYANFLEAEGEARIHEAYPDLTYRRLAQVKRAYDPTNLFRLNQNIRPAAEA